MQADFKKSGSTVKIAIANAYARVKIAEQHAVAENTKNQIVKIVENYNKGIDNAIQVADALVPINR